MRLFLFFSAHASIFSFFMISSSFSPPPPSFLPPPFSPSSFSSFLSYSFCTNSCACSFLFFFLPASIFLHDLLISSPTPFHPFAPLFIFLLCSSCAHRHASPNLFVLFMPSLSIFLFLPSCLFASSMSAFVFSQYSYLLLF